jgi:hypothetical protein
MKQLWVVAAALLSTAMAAGAWGQSLIVNFDDYVLTEAESPLVVSHVIIQNNGTLFLEPGVELVITGKLDDRPLWLRHGGRLVANGTQEKPVIIRQSAPNSNVVAERWGGEDHGTIIDLNHTVWDMGVSRLVLLENPEENYPDAEPIIIARNSVIRSSPPTRPDEWEDWWEWVEDWESNPGPMIMSVGAISGQWYASPMHLLFEDSLLFSPTVTAIGIADNQVLTMRRCVVQGAHLEDGFRFGIQVIDWWAGSLIKVEDSRFVGNIAGIGHFGEAHGYVRIVQVSGSDFSQTGFFLMEMGYGPFSLSVEDSHIWETYIDSTFEPRTMVFTRCFSEDGPLTPTPPRTKSSSTPRRVPLPPRRYQRRQPHRFLRPAGADEGPRRPRQPRNHPRYRRRWRHHHARCGGAEGLRRRHAPLPSAAGGQLMRCHHALFIAGILSCTTLAPPSSPSFPRVTTSGVVACRFAMLSGRMESPRRRAPCSTTSFLIPPRFASHALIVEHGRCCRHSPARATLMRAWKSSSPAARA